MPHNKAKTATSVEKKKRYRTTKPGRLGFKGELGPTHAEKIANSKKILAARKAEKTRSNIKKILRGSRKKKSPSVKSKVTQAQRDRVTKLAKKTRSQNIIESTIDTHKKSRGGITSSGPAIIVKRP